MINANLVFISVLVCLSYFLIPGGPFPWRSKTCVSGSGGRCCYRSGETLIWNGYLFTNTLRKFRDEVLGYCADERLVFDLGQR